ncbi:MAG: DMT family transporter [Hoeflea sp.]|uniref:DMT family transporter n=1 Tax=Hoeflea sp. TaxID=1940281 RepID=UPI0027308923|nr:DMT family transporter [Hoeflea sp.]MDP2121365.1 DMT family transporter [Hoeflea sp.]
MTAVSADAPAQSSRPLEGIACVLGGAWCFVGQDLLIKDLLGAQPLWMLIFVRACISILVLAPLILWLGGNHRLYTPLWPIHLVRAFLLTAGFAMFYAAFPFMPLAEVSTIFFSAPLFIGILAALFLGERMGIHRIVALMVGFSGVVLAMAPGQESFQWVALLPLFCALSYAASMILTRRVGDGESSLTMGLWTIGGSGVMIWPLGWLVTTLVPMGPEFHHLRLEFIVPGVEQMANLALLGVVGMTGYILLSRAYQVANASLIAPFDYAYLPFAATAAWFFWGEVPSLNTLSGMALIIGAGLYIGYRELRAPARAVSPAPVGETVIATGVPAVTEDSAEPPDSTM